MRKLTALEVLKKYKGKFIVVYQLPFYEVDTNGNRLYEVRKSYTSIKENTTQVLDINFINNY